MSCSLHAGREAVGVCSDCGRNLCRECLEQFNPPTCPQCMVNWGNEIIKQNIIKLVLSAFLAIVGLVAGLGESVLLGIVGFLIYGGVPWGWAALNRITPRIFLFLPIVGWVIYFFIKVALSVAIGVFVFPFQIAKYVRHLKIIKRAKSLVQ